MLHGNTYYKIAWKCVYTYPYEMTQYLMILLKFCNQYECVQNFELVCSYIRVLKLHKFYLKIILNSIFLTVHPGFNFRILFKNTI